MHPWAGLPARRALYSKLGVTTGWSIRLLTTSVWKDEYGKRIAASAVPQPGSDLVAVPVALSGNIPLHFFVGRLRKQITQFDPDLIYIYHEPYAAATYQMLRAARAVSKAPVGVRSAQNLVKRYPVPFRLTESYVYRNSDFAVVVSDNVARVLRSKGYSKPIDVIPMPVDLSTFTPAAGRSGKPDGPLRVGFVGRLVPEKGLDTAIYALAMTDAKVAKLEVIGAGPDEGRLRRLAAEAGVADRVTWRGALEGAEVARSYQGMDVIVVPSRPTPRWSEQFGRVVIEAAAAGVPAIVSNSGELPFLVRQIGAGWVVGQTDVSNLAETLRRLHCEPSEVTEAGRAARAGVERDFSDDAIVDSLARTFRQTAQLRRGSL